MEFAPWAWEAVHDNHTGGTLCDSCGDEIQSDYCLELAGQHICARCVRRHTVATPGRKEVNLWSRSPLPPSRPCG